MMAPTWVLYRKAEGDFEKPVALKTDEDKHIVARGENDRATVTERICTQPHAVDWDGDGDLDLLIGNFKGTFMVATNVGTKTEPKFKGEAEWLLNAAGEHLKIDGIHSAPIVVDWDGDGDLDIISGAGAGGVQIAVNEPTEDGKHSFAKFEALIPAPEGGKRSAGLCPKDAPVLPSGSSRVCVCDYNGDGKLDLLVGDLLRRSHPKGELTIEEAEAKDKELQAQIRAESDSLREKMQEIQALEDEEEKAKQMAELQEKSKAMRELYKKRQEFIESVSTGHVWLYVQK